MCHEHSFCGQKKNETKSNPDYHRGKMEGSDACSKLSAKHQIARNRNKKKANIKSILGRSAE
jgi:hypothetical protein